MKQIQKVTLAIALTTLFSFCAVFKDNSVPKYETDPVCGMKVNKSEGFTHKYEGKTYFFDTYSCQQAFIMNPQKFLDKK